MTGHRVPLHQRALRRHPDPLRSRDPRVVAVVEQLRGLELAEAPTETFRADLRAQLVAITPRIVADEAEPAAGTTTRPRPYRVAEAAPELPPATPSRADRPRRRVSLPVVRPLRVVSTLVLAFVLVLAGATWLSQEALPGDALYGLKLAGERAELAVAGDEDEQARDHLEFARTRVDEARALLGRPSASGTGLRADGAVSGATAKLISDTLHRADTETRSASRLLGELAVRSASGRPMSAMTDWAPAQIDRLTALWKSMPTSGLRDRTSDSRELVRQAEKRAAALRGKADCSCLQGGRSDSLGPIPCTSCVSRPPASTSTGSSRAATPHRTSGASRRTHAPSAHRSGTSSTTARPGGRNTGSSPAPSRSTTPVIPLPSLPLPGTKTALPASAPSSCINLLDVVHIGNCPSS